MNDSLKIALKQIFLNVYTQNLDFFSKKIMTLELLCQLGLKKAQSFGIFLDWKFKKS